MADNLQPIPGYEGLYMASTDGRVWSCRQKKFMKDRYDKDGYKKIGIVLDGKQKTYQVHQLIAMTFIPNPFGLTEVNHKNGKRDDNRVENLEWVTHIQNMRKSNACKKTLCVDTGEVFHSASDAARAKGLSRKGVSCAAARKGTSGGFHWEYIEE